MGWLELEGKAVIVTGGAAGIGRACCEGLAEVGASVVVADINEEGASALAEELNGRTGGGPPSPRLRAAKPSVASAKEGGHIAVGVDVTNRKSVDGMIRATLEAFGRLDCLLNNAGIDVPRLLVDPAGKEELTEDIWDRVVAVNQKGFFLCAQAAARVMMKAESGGVIVNMASESGMEGSEGQSVYAGTKAAVYSLTRSWAKELGRHNIRVVGVAPGILEPTPLRSEEYERALAYTRGITADELREGYKKLPVPLGRVGRLKEVADTVCFLASPRAGYIHGTTINVSGGKSRA